MSATVQPSLLISSEKLLSQLDDKTVLPIFVGSEAVFEQAHIPGAVHIAPAELLCGIAPAVGKMAELDDLAALFSRLGLTAAHTVVAYDDEGGGWAGRLIWTLDIIGHQHYHYLDGGLIAWHGEGRPLNQGRAHPAANTKANTYPVEIQTAQRITAEGIIEQLGDEKFAIWDARSAAEYRGEKVLAARGGHIPGAINLDWLELMDRGNHLKLKPLEEIKNRLQEIGLPLDAAIVTHCQTHHRSGLSYLVGKLLGLDIKAYDGSWSEWGNLPHSPIETHTDNAP